MKLEFIVQNDNIRLTEELKTHVSRKLYKHIKGYGAEILLNGNKTETYVFVKKGDIITIYYEHEEDIQWPLYDMQLNIVFENENYLIVDKPSGVLTIPTKAEPKSVFQGVCYHLKEKGEAPTISILNRLDKGTSGLMMIAKNPYFANLMNPVHEKMERRYLALVHGLLGNKEGFIEAPIKKSEELNKRIIDSDGDYAYTSYKLISTHGDISLVEYVLKTGRTHQIRVHSKYIGHPLCGDELYGIEDNFSRLMLHSYLLEFVDPITNKLMHFESDYDILSTLLENKRNEEKL